MVYTDRIHMVADSFEELHAFARFICLKKCWFDPIKRHPHYDLVNKNKEPLMYIDGTTFIHRAILSGALVVSPKKIAVISKKMK